jgi:hypothetical protein
LWDALGFTWLFKGRNPLKFNPGNTSEGYGTQTARLETNTLVEGNLFLVRNEEGTFVRTHGCKAPLVLSK